MKYLDRQEVEKILLDFKIRVLNVEETFSKLDCEYTNYGETMNNLVKNYRNDICNLAVPQIDKDKIVEAIVAYINSLDAHRYDDFPCNGLASEIIKAIGGK